MYAIHTNTSNGFPSPLSMLIDRRKEQKNDIITSLLSIQTRQSLTNLPSQEMEKKFKEKDSSFSLYVEF